MGSVLPMMRHFLNRLRSALLRSLKSGWTCLSIYEKGDLHLMQSLLEKSTKGISINNVVFRKPTHIYCSDASEFGLGGYNLISGRAWRFEIPPDYRLRTSINSLEFLACIITVWIDFIHNEIPEESCILSQTDNSSAAGWLRKSNFADDANYAIQLTTARHIAQLVIDNNCCLNSQWFTGDFNLVSDCLSRDFHLTDDALTNLIASSISHQVPFGFLLSPIPTEVSSWLTCLLCNQPFKEEWCKEQTKSKLLLGADSNYTCCPSAFAMTGSLNLSIEDNVIRSWEHLQQPSEKVDFLLQNLRCSEVTQSEPPWIVYHRPFHWLTSQTQDSTLTATLHSFFNDNLDVTQH